jgi:hypothetical protein
VCTLLCAESALKGRILNSDSEKQNSINCNLVIVNNPD